MTIRERTQRYDAANRQARKVYVDRLYTKGWTPRPEHNSWDVLETAIAVAAVLFMLAWLMVGK